MVERAGRADARLRQALERRVEPPGADFVVGVDEREDRRRWRGARPRLRSSPTRTPWHVEHRGAGRARDRRPSRRSSRCRRRRSRSVGAGWLSLRMLAGSVAAAPASLRTGMTNESAAVIGRGSRASTAASMPDGSTLNSCRAPGMRVNISSTNTDDADDQVGEEAALPVQLLRVLHRAVGLHARAAGSRRTGRRRAARTGSARGGSGR